MDFFALVINILIDLFVDRDSCSNLVAYRVGVQIGTTAGVSAVGAGL
jgi:hypothetical protein